MKKRRERVMTWGGRNSGGRGVGIDGSGAEVAHGDGETLIFGEGDGK